MVRRSSGTSRVGIFSRMEFADLWPRMSWISVSGVSTWLVPFRLRIGNGESHSPDRDVSASESFHFTMMLDACEKNDPHSALTNLIVWLGMWRQMHGSSSSDRFARKVASISWRKKSRVLREARVSGLKDWSGATLGAVIHARDKLIQRPTS